MKKVIGSLICLTLGALLVFTLRASGTSGPTSSYSEQTKIISSMTTIHSETANVMNHSIEQKNTFFYEGEKIQYLLIFPAAYSKTTTQWPLILFLHGSSGRGSDLKLVENYGPPFIAKEQLNFPFVVLAPQCPAGEDWTSRSDLLAALLDDVLKKYRIHQDKVYLTGTSMGGNGTWQLACQHPEYFAAIAPLASSPKIPETWDARLLSLPIWAFHGEKDPTCPLQDEEAMISAVRMQGGTPRFTVLPDQGHYITAVYKDQGVYDWFLANTRKH